MVKSTFKILVGAATIVCACDGGSDEPSVTRDDAEHVAEDAVGGTALAAELMRDVDPPLWRVDIEMANGGAIEAKVHANEAHLVELEAFEGPFDYAFVPVDGVLSYADMMADALDEIDGTIEAWKFAVREEEDELEFEFYVRDPDGQLWEIKFDAVSGDPTDIKQKDDVDQDE